MVVLRAGLWIYIFLSNSVALQACCTIYYFRYTWFQSFRSAGLPILWSKDLKENGVLYCSSRSVCATGRATGLVYAKSGVVLFSSSFSTLSFRQQWGLVRHSLRSLDVSQVLWVTLADIGRSINFGNGYNKSNYLLWRRLSVIGVGSDDFPFLLSWLIAFRN